MSPPTMIDAVRDHLVRFPPFDRIPPAELVPILEQTEIRYVDVGETLFDIGQRALDHFFVVKNGAIELSRGEGQGDALLDLADEGDVFGVRALMGTESYSATARAREDSLVYVIPWAPFRAVVDRTPPAALFFAAGFAAELPKLRGQLLEATGDLQRESVGPADDGDTIVPPIRDVVTALPEDTIQAVARAMRARGVGSVIVVDDTNRPVGIVTDSDLRRRVVAEGVDVVSTPVSAVMSHPVLTAKAPITVAELVGLVMRANMHHFCITEDGTADTEVTGVLSEHDLVTVQGHHPTVLRHKMARCRDPEVLSALRDRAEVLLERMLSRGAQMSYIAAMITGINDVLIRSSLRIATTALEHEGRPRPAEPFCFLAFGSEGRREQLLRTDLDQAIVFADPPTERAAAVHDYFVELGVRVTDLLVQAGFARCRGGIMASNPELTGPLSAWKDRFSEWIEAPEPRALMNASIFFDLRAVDGEAALAEQLIAHVHENVRRERGFLPFLAHSALLNPPPLSFFRNFLVERSGEHADEFDLKARAMMPLSDAARVLVYDLRIDPVGTTAERFRRVAVQEESLTRLAEEAAMAYEILMRVRAQEGLRTQTSGRYVDVARLNQLERRTLRNTFAVIADVQRMLTSRYRTDFIR